MKSFARKKMDKKEKVFFKKENIPESEQSLQATIVAVKNKGKIISTNR